MAPTKKTKGKEGAKPLEQKEAKAAAERQDTARPGAKHVCIVCEQERDGAAVRDDAIITALRKVKGAIGIARNNRLVVCGECMPKYKEKRGRFEKTLVQYVALAAIILVLLVALPLLIGAAFRIETLLLGLVMGLFIVALSVFAYVPALAGESKA